MITLAAAAKSLLSAARWTNGISPLSVPSAKSPLYGLLLPLTLVGYYPMSEMLTLEMKKVGMNRACSIVIAAQLPAVVVLKSRLKSRIKAFKLKSLN